MIKASALLVVAFCITWLLKQRAAAERHVVWTAAILSAAALPVLTLLLPSWHPALAQRVAAALPAISVTNTGTRTPHGADVVFRADGIDQTLLSRAWPLLWFAGSMTGLLFFGIGTIQQRRLARRSSASSDHGLARITADLTRKLGCRRSVHLRESLDQPMPMTWGVFRPQILLPNCVGDWSEERKRMVIAHELAHVQRMDWFVQTVAQIACAVYWFNPLFWIACKHLYRESEHACDDAVINLGVDAREYASHLLHIARTVRQSGGVWSATLAMARQSTLEKRFATLLKSKRDRRGVTRKAVLSIAALTLIAVVPLAAIRISTAAALPTASDDASRAQSALPKVEQYTTPPLYSDEARARAIEGIVTVEVRIGVDGTVKRLRVVKGLGYGLDENALLAVRDWRFAPARRNGRPLEATTQIDVEFNLRNAELNEEIANDMATRIGPGVTPPQVVHRIDPEYFTAGRRETLQGPVVLDAVILEDGTPKIVRVIRSLEWELDEIAINALRQWRFSPAMQDGNPVKVRMNIAVTFQPKVG
jgi:TonB family protein